MCICPSVGKVLRKWCGMSANAHSNSGTCSEQSNPCTRQRFCILVQRSRRGCSRGPRRTGAAVCQRAHRPQLRPHKGHAGKAGHLCSATGKHLPEDVKSVQAEAGAEQQAILELQNSCVSSASRRLPEQSLVMSRCSFRRACNSMAEACSGVRVDRHQGLTLAAWASASCRLPPQQQIPRCSYVEVCYAAYCQVNGGNIAASHHK